MAHKARSFDVITIAPTDTLKRARETRTEAPEVAVPTHWDRYGWALATTLICTLIAFAMQSRFEPANIVMVYVLGATIAGVRFGRGPAVVTAIAGDAPVRSEPAPRGDPSRLFPDLTPDRFGAYLTRAWSVVRARHLFDPWYEASPGTAIDFDPAVLEPERLAREHRALLRATAARELAAAMQSQGGK